MDFYDITLSDIERLLRSLQEARPGDADLIKQIINRVQPDQTLLHPRVTIGSLFKLLEQTNGATALPDDIVKMLKAETEPPSSLACATVVKVEEQQPKPEDFEQLGTRVRLRADSYFVDQNSGEGIVEKQVRYGWVQVKWLNNNCSYNYQTGQGGECDLELVEPLPSIITVRSIDGQTMKIPAPTDRTWQVGDTVTIDQQTKQLLPQPESQTSLVRATVLKINQREPAPADFERIGARVRLRADSRFTSQDSGEGVVQSKDNTGWVLVKWLGDGRSYNYRTGAAGDGDCDLELVESLRPTVTVVINDSGKLLEVLAPTDYLPGLGHEVQVDRSTMQIVLAK